MIVVFYYTRFPVDRPNTHASPRFNLILGKLRAKIYVKYQRRKIEGVSVIIVSFLISRITNSKNFFFFSFSLLVCDCCITRLREEQRSRRVKIEIQRFSLLTNRIPLRSSEFRRYFPYFLPPIINETSLVNLCLFYVLCRRYQEKTVSFFLFFGLFFHHISHSTACPTRGRKRLHWARQKVINDRKTS